MTSPILTDWFGGPAQLAEHWEQQPYVAPRTGASPFSTADLDAIVAGGGLRTPYLEMVRSDRRPVPVGSYTRERLVNGDPVTGIVDPAGLSGCLDAGATLLLRNVEHWHLATGDLCRQLESELGRPVEAFFFLTPPNEQGLAIHRDDADVVVVQVAGSKRWHIGTEPPPPGWQAGELGADEQPRELLHATVRTGDALYIPRGFAHYAVGEDSISAHLSFTIRPAATAEAPAPAGGLRQRLRQLSRRN